MFVVAETTMTLRVLTNQLMLAWRKISEDQTGGITDMLDDRIYIQNDFQA